MHLSTSISGADLVAGKARLVFRRLGRKETQLDVDHVIAATGYKAAVSRSTSLISGCENEFARPMKLILDRQFQSSIQGLYFVGAAAANSFGPLLHSPMAPNSRPSDWPRAWQKIRPVTRPPQSPSDYPHAHLSRRATNGWARLHAVEGRFAIS